MTGRTQDGTEDFPLLAAPTSPTALPVRQAGLLTASGSGITARAAARSGR
jgi:hypothetical protein